MNEATLTLNPNRKGDLMSDVKLSGFDFSSTVVTAEPQTEAGRALFAETFGPGVVSVNLPKSRAGEFIAHVEKAGLSIR